MILDFLFKLFNYSIITEFIVGIFITLEGIDGAGKTTAANLIADSLREAGYRVLLTQEPTGTYLGTVVKDIIIGRDFGKNIDLSFLKTSSKKTVSIMALFLFSADRVVHLEEISIKLKDFDVILCDRFIDSTYAYQAAYSSGKDDKSFEELILTINDFVLGQKNVGISRTYLFDLKPEDALKRLNGRAGKFDGFDSEPLDFFDRVRTNYIYLADRFKSRIKKIDAAAPVKDTANIIIKDIVELINALP
ncbi:MAG: dTMP kinase [Candidatus Acidulodesulfobacterium ferriphilum]|jgi:dTMP kinase|uniref:Thymidylate kinase n=1 Tax=Candidatus Acidulodesulfobacterium ferriphilum TaxID=2597223 RepID=A0A519BC79_9DELT|nr:MAG: dTMP kinase [Candidatus Acidulodesulfobacterium ferriphilum]